jgi:hypothetical protein
MSDNPIVDLDDYELRHLVAHLAESGRPDDLHHLLALETSEQRNAWHNARERVGDTDGFLADIARAWQLADEVGARHSAAEALGLQTRYALVVASINSLYSKIPPELVVALVKNQLWTPAQSLTAARRNPNSVAKKEILVELADHLPMELLAEGLSVARAIGNRRDRAEALAALGLRLSGEQQLLVLREAFDVAQGITTDWQRGETYAALAPYLPPSLLHEALRDVQEHPFRTTYTKTWRETLATLSICLARVGPPDEALAAAWSIGDSWSLGQVLQEIASFLPAALMRKMLDISQITDDTGWEAWQAALRALAPHLCEWVLHEILEIAKAIDDPTWQVWIVLAIAAYLPEDDRLAVLHETIRLTRMIADDQFKIKGLVALASHLPDVERLPVLHEALELVKTLGHPVTRVQELVVLVPLLRAPERLLVLKEILTTLVRKKKDRRWHDPDRAQLIVALAPYLPLSLLAQALDATRITATGQSRVEALAALFPLLSEEERLPVMREALAAADNLWCEDNWAPLLGMLTLQPSALALNEMLTVVQTIDLRTRAWVLGKLAGCIPTSLVYDVLAAARALPNHDRVPTSLQPRMKALVALAPHLPGEERQLVLQEALAAAQEIGDEYAQVTALIAWAIHLPEEDRRHVLQKTLGVAQSMGQRHGQAAALAAIIPHLAEEERPPIVRAALDTAQARRHDVRRHEALLAVAPYLPIADRLSVLTQVLNEVRRRRDAPSLASELLPIVPHLPEVLLPEALDIVWKIDSLIDRRNVLAALAPRLPEPLLRQALEVERSLEPILISEVENPVYVRVQDEDLAQLLPRLAEIGAAHEALPQAETIADPYFRALGLAGIAKYLPESERTPVLRDTLTVAQTESGKWRQAHLLVTLAPLLSESLRLEALVTARNLDDAALRAWVLASLAPYLPAQEQQAALRDALATIQGTGTADQKVQVLSILVPCLAGPLANTALDMVIEMDDDYLRAHALQVIALSLARLPTATLCTLWCKLLHRLAARTRANVLTELAAMGSVLTVLGDEVSAIEAAEAIGDVTRWWP